MHETRVIQRGRYFDELEVAEVYAHAPGRTVTEADNVLFTTLTMNTQSGHLDAARAAGTEFGERWTRAAHQAVAVGGEDGLRITLPLAG